MSNPSTDQFVDAVYAELEKLYAKDKNMKKDLLGNSPIRRIFDVYADWLANNLALSPKLAANSIYRDVMNVGYVDFPNRKLKKGVQLKSEPGFNLIYGTQKEIDKALQMLAQVKGTDPQRYDLILTACEKVKQLSSTVKPAKNIFGKTTAAARQTVSNFKMPTFQTFELFMKMNPTQLKNYINKIDKAL